MTLTEFTLHQYRRIQASEEKWTWAQAFWFVFISCGLFWAGVIALILRFL